MSQQDNPNNPGNRNAGQNADKDAGRQGQTGQQQRNPQQSGQQRNEQQGGQRQGQNEPERRDRSNEQKNDG